MNKFLVFLIIAGIVYLSTFMSGGQVGAGSTCEGSKCITYASSSIWSVILSLCLLCFLIFYPQQKSIRDEEKTVGVWRRFGAFYLDFMVVIIGVTPLLAIPLLWMESTYIGQFQWAFEREYSRELDAYLVLPSIGVAFFVLFYYFYKHPKAGRQTLGQYILGYKVVADTSELQDAEFGKRVIYSYIGLCTAPISVYFALKKTDKSFWWDSATNTRAIRVSVVNNTMHANKSSRVT